MFKKALALTGALFALLTLSSCLESDTTISLKKDGSGTLTETLIMGAQMMAMMQVGGEDGGEGVLTQLDEESLKKKAEAYGEGVEFLEVKKEEKNGKMIIKSVFTFADIGTLKFAPGGTMSSPEDFQEKATAPFSFADGELTIALPDPSKEDFSFGDAEMGEEQLAMMAPMMAGLKMTAQILCEDGIDSTNATYHEGNVVTLMKMSFDDLMKNEEGMAVMKKLKTETREEFATAVNEIQGFDVEYQEKASVKLK